MSTESACQLVCLACLSAGIALLEPFPEIHRIFASPPVGKRSIVMSVSVCLSVCVIVCLRSYLRNYTSDLRHFLCMLPMAVAQSSSGSVVICYVLPVLWMTSYLLISQGCSTSPLS